MCDQSCCNAELGPWVIPTSGSSPKDPRALEDRAGTAQGTASPCQGCCQDIYLRGAPFTEFHISQNSVRNCSHTARKLRIIFLLKDSDLSVLQLIRLCMFMQIKMPLSQLFFPTKYLQQSINLLNFLYIILTLPTYVIWCKAPNISPKLRVILAFFFQAV